jgi:hypothetical protein
MLDPPVSDRADKYRIPVARSSRFVSPGHPGLGCEQPRHGRPPAAGQARIGLREPVLVAIGTISSTAIPVAKLVVKRDDGAVEGSKNENEFYRGILRRAKSVRERAAESLKQSRAMRKRQGDPGGQTDAAQRRRRFRRED